jgi:hypothetical protein
MNERIQDLIKQSGGHWNRDLTMDHHGNFITSHSVKFQKDDIEKFAELIVQECINAVYDDGQDAEYYQDRIKRRFGVE